MDTDKRQSGNLDFIDSFKMENWNRSSLDEKVQNLQKLEDYMAEKQGRIPRQVRVLEMKGSTRGYYDQQDPRYLTINKSLMEKSDLTKPNNYRAMDCVIHEGRHAYQDDAVIGRLKTDEKDTGKIEQWAKNSPGLGGVYNTYKDKKGVHRDIKTCSYIDYRFQPVEADANDYAKENMDSFGSRLKDDRSYSEYTTTRDFSSQYHKAQAREFYGDNYKERIAKSINERYEVKNRMKTVSRNEEAKPRHIESEKKAPELRNEIRRLSKAKKETSQAAREKSSSGLSRKGNSNSHSPKGQETGRQPGKSIDRGR